MPSHPAVPSRTRRRLGLALLAAPALAFGQAPASRPLNVVASTSLLADLLRQIGGERLQVRALIGPGHDPHLYRPTRSDIVHLVRADLICWHGLNLEPQLQRLFGALRTHKPLHALAEHIPTADRLTDPGGHQQPDPHVWMDVRLWRALIPHVRDLLSAHDPAGAAHYRARAADYAATLDQLHHDTLARLHRVPPAQRILVTAHDAFRYFGRAYGYQVLGLQGLSTESEASLRRIERLIEQLVEHRIPAVFTESAVPDQGLRALLEGAAARGHHARIGGSLYADSLGPPGSGADTYTGMIAHNSRTIAHALGADPD